MNLRNRIGDLFLLESVGYQFPNMVDHYWDSNWLNIRVIAGNEFDSWSIEDPWLLTFEVESLAAWLLGFAADKSVNRHMVFTRPSPQFRFIQYRTGAYLLRVDLGHIFRKKSASLFGQRKTIHLYFPLTDRDLSYQAYLLREQLKKYPQRVF